MIQKGPLSSCKHLSVDKRQQGSDLIVLKTGLDQKGQSVEIEKNKSIRGGGSLKGTCSQERSSGRWGN